MKHDQKHSLMFQVAARLLLPGQILLGLPLPARAENSASKVVDEPAGDADPKPGPSEHKSVLQVPPKGTANRKVPKVQPPPASPRFSEKPTDQEIFRARVFEEPLVPMGETSVSQNLALAQALLTYLGARAREDVSALEGFLKSYRSTPWRASLLVNLGIVYRHTGHFSRAIEAEREAWDLARSATSAQGRAVADRALGEVAELLSRLGRFEELESLFSQMENRELTGPVTEKIAASKQGLWLMKNRPEIAFRCGPLAIEAILRVVKPELKPDFLAMSDALSTRKGTSLAQMKGLAAKLSLPMRMAMRSPGSSVLAPALVHWRAGHFAAILEARDGQYRIQDPTFGEEFWASQKAVDDEASGHFLVLDRELPSGWRPLSEEEGGEVWGKGAANGQSLQPQTCQANQTGGNGGGLCSSSSCGSGPSCPVCPPMAVYSFNTMLAALRIVDAPVAYSPPRGPRISFQVTYNQRDVFQPQLFTYSNLGPKWTFGWLAYIEDDPNNVSQTVNLYRAGGGQETYSGYNGGTYLPHYQSRATLVRVSSSRYERKMPDGSVEVYSQPDGSFAFPRKVFLTSWIDPQGNAAQLIYDDTLRLVAVVDSIGQVTSLFYDSLSDPLKITRVADPFGRTATFDYDASGRLVKITDVIGISSEMIYDANDFVSTLTTPYGTTRFSAGQTGADRSLQAIDPLGGTERIEYINGHTTLIPATDPSATVPTGFAPSNQHLDTSISFFWDKRAMALAAGDYTKAEQTHWLWTNGTTQSSGIPRATKKPLENRVWYAYTGQPGPLYLGTNANPITIARVLDDGTSQLYRYEYSALGTLTRETDPVGRATVYDYDPTNNIDLLSVKQVNGPSTDLLASYTYNSLHEPLTATDASGQTTTYTYNSAGQVLTVTTPPRAGITENRTTTRSYDASGYLQSIMRPATGATTLYSYDGYGRFRTMTDSEGYVLTTDYDALDRPTTVTYPDGTYTQTIYNRLDPQDKRDRVGRWSHTFYDALRRTVSVRDPANRTITQQWCNCGSLDRTIDPSGNATSWERDLQGRVTKETRADGSLHTFTYETTTSRLKTKIDPKAQVTTYTYFLDDDLKQKVYTNAPIATPTVSLTYDPAYRRKLTMTDGTGTTTYAYYPITVPPTLGAGRLQAVDGPLANDNVTYSYDERGRVATSGLSAFSTILAYDALGRLTSMASPVGTFSWGYVNTTGRPHTATYPNGQVTTYSYFNNVGDQRLQEIKHQQSSGGAVLSQFDYAYDSVGNIQTWQQAFGASAAKVYGFGYDGSAELISAVQKDASTQQILKNYGYAYDPAGNRTVAAQDSTATTSQYNSRNQLTQQTGGAALPVAGLLSEPATVTLNGTPAVVSAANQFAGSAQAGTGTQNLTVVAADPSGNTRTNTYQVTVSGTAQNFVYDANGNLCAKGGTTCTNGTTTYQWDAENRLMAVLQGASTVASFMYDGMGRRVQRVAGGVTHTYVHDDQNIIEERLSSGQTYDFVQAPGLDRPLAQRDQASVISYYLADHLGSVAQVTNGAGAVTLTREYDAWGNLIQGTTTAGYSFTGREWDPETGLYYYRARYYDPTVSRFISEDPIPTKNLYAYVDNNPLRFTDPTGMVLCGIGNPCSIPGIGKWLCNPNSCKTGNTTSLQATLCDCQSTKPVEEACNCLCNTFVPFGYDQCIQDCKACNAYKSAADICKCNCDLIKNNPPLREFCLKACKL